MYLRALEPALHLIVRDDAGLLMHEASVSQDDERGDAAHVEPCAELAVLIRIDLQHHSFASPCSWRRAPPRARPSGTERTMPPRNRRAREQAILEPPHRTTRRRRPPVFRGDRAGSCTRRTAQCAPDGPRGHGSACHNVDTFESAQAYRVMGHRVYPPRRLTRLCRREGCTLAACRSG